MASFSLTGSTFPNGTSVGAYPATNWTTGTLPPSGAAPGSATASATVTAGTAAFTGLAANTRYYAGASVSGTWRYVSFFTGTGSNNVRSGGVSDIYVLTQAEYDALTPNDQTLYVISG